MVAVSQCHCRGAGDGVGRRFLYNLVWLVGYTTVWRRISCSLSDVAISIIARERATTNSEINLVEDGAAVPRPCGNIVPI
jgi:hypothetical protein